jgi:hypothetical protein
MLLKRKREMNRAKVCCPRKIPKLSAYDSVCVFLLKAGGLEDIEVGV